jgi:hypothetical protein
LDANDELLLDTEIVAPVNVDGEVYLAVYEVALPLGGVIVPLVIVRLDDANDETELLIVKVISAFLLANILVLADEMVTYVLLVIIERLSAVDEKLVLESLLVPDTKIDPVVVVDTDGVKVAVYVSLSVVVGVDKVPPLKSMTELLNLVVAVLILNVIVAVCPA